MSEETETIPTPATEQPVAGRVLLVEQAGGERLRITIPEGAKVTFGPLVPSGGRKSPYHTSPEDSGGTALRIYSGTSKEDQLACFRNVRNFRDASLVVEKEVVDEKAEAEVVRDADGTRVQNREERIKKWVRA